MIYDPDPTGLVTVFWPPEPVCEPWLSESVDDDASDDEDEADDDAWVCENEDELVPIHKSYINLLQHWLLEFLTTEHWI